MNKILLFSTLLLLTVFLYLIFWQRPNPDRDFEGRVQIRDKVYEVEFAKTADEKMRGLSGREEIRADHGMLFFFPQGSKSGFWMKGMNFPIDIIWISEGKVVGFVEDARPAKEVGLKIYHPPQKIDMVLELQSGQVKEGGFQIGDVLVLN